MEGTRQRQAGNGQSKRTIFRVNFFKRQARNGLTNPLFSFAEFGRPLE